MLKRERGRRGVAGPPARCQGIALPNPAAEPGDHGLPDRGDEAPGGRAEGAHAGDLRPVLADRTPSGRDRRRKTGRHAVRPRQAGGDRLTHRAAGGDRHRGGRVLHQPGPLGERYPGVHDGRSQRGPPPGVGEPRGRGEPGGSRLAAAGHRQQLRALARRQGAGGGRRPERPQHGLGQAAPDWPLLPPHLWRHREHAAYLVGRRTLGALPGRREHQRRDARRCAGPTAPGGRGHSSHNGPRGARPYRPATDAGWCSGARSSSQARATSSACGWETPRWCRWSGAPRRRLDVAVSPDGRWIAYASEESGVPEIYVRPFPDAESARWQVSAAGGSDPVWSRNGRELFYSARRMR